jgi:hypothetical protein
VNLRTRAYAVAAGGRLTDSWELQGFAQGIYHLLACGPNGFLREFVGSSGDPRVEIRCGYAREGNVPTGDIELHVANRTARPMEVRVMDLSYKSGDHTMTIAPGGNRALAMPLGVSHQWYDFSVAIAGEDQFLRRFAGRVKPAKVDSAIRRWDEPWDRRSPCNLRRKQDGNGTDHGTSSGIAGNGAGSRKGRPQGLCHDAQSGRGSGTGKRASAEGTAGIGSHDGCG